MNFATTSCDYTSCEREPECTVCMQNPKNLREPECNVSMQNPENLSNSQKWNWNDPDFYMMKDLCKMKHDGCDYMCKDCYLE